MYEGRNEIHKRENRSVKIMERLSYTAHLSSKDHAINSKSKLSGVAKHNLRKYRSEEYDRENIVILWGTDKLVQDVKRVYREQFDEAVREYNANQTREDRKIINYYEKVAGNKKKDMAVELIFQLGDKEYWDNNPEKRRWMDYAFDKILEKLQEEEPNLVIANAVVHYDEASPHMHVVAVPVADGFKKGLEKQVSKRKVCTKEFLENVLQGKLRDFVDANIIMWLDEIGLNKKQEGRNIDLSVVEYKRQQEQKKYDELVENKKQINIEIGQKSFENQMAEQKLEDTYKRLADAQSNIIWKVEDISQLERVIENGPDEPKGLMSAKAYRDKIVMPFINKIGYLVKEILGFSKKCIARAYELEKEIDKIKTESESVYKTNKELHSRLRYKEDVIEEKQKEIDRLEDDSTKLGFFKRFLKPSVYDEVVRLGEEERDKLLSRGSR